MKQFTMFTEGKPKEDNTYTGKIESPVYEPKNKKPHTLELFDHSKYKRFKNEILNSSVSDEEKTFLLMAATRHIVFNYELIADYYAHSNKEMQDLMERSALIIIDFEKAIQLGYVKLSKEIKNQYLEEYG
jgi:hypothetical protein